MKTPIATPHEVKPTMEPLGFISPTLDGQVTHFYEWREAGYFSAKTSGGSMYRGEGFIPGFTMVLTWSVFIFGSTRSGGKRPTCKGLQFNIHISHPREWQILFPLKFLAGEKPSFSLYARGEEGLVLKGRFSHIGAGKIVELSLAFQELQFHSQEKVHFFLQIQRGDLEVERYPRSGYLSLIIPDRDFESVHWQI